LEPFGLKAEDLENFELRATVNGVQDRTASPRVGGEEHDHPEFPG
jgi:hypothetical protein